MGARRQRCVNTAWLLQPGARQTLAVPCGCASWISATSGSPTLNPVSWHRCAPAPHRFAAAPGHCGLDMSTLEQLGQCITTCLQPELSAGCQTHPWSCPSYFCSMGSTTGLPRARRCVTGEESPWLMHVTEAESDKCAAAQT